MSSNCPPQLQLSLQPNTTSFKRSFEQFGFDLESPVDGAGGGSSNTGNDRNKRARSASSFSDSADSMDSSQSSTLASGSSSSPRTLARREEDGRGSTTTTASVVGSSLGPPRLPTPQIQDIEMPDYPVHEENTLRSEERYRLSLERFNAFDSQIAVLRQSQPGSPARLPTTPPVLPPLAIGISGDQPRLSLSNATIPFLHPHPQPSTPLTEALFGADNPEEVTAQSSPADDLEMMQGFRARLTGALERLRPQSPLVPGLGFEEQDEEEEQEEDVEGEDERDDQGDEEEQEDLEADDLLPEPPTLPPIPSIVSDPDIDHFNLEDLLTREGSGRPAFSTVIEATTASSDVSPTLGDHPLPSPVLRDLHSWMDERGRSSEGSSSGGQRAFHHYHPAAGPSTVLPSSHFRRRADEAAVRALDGGVFGARTLSRRQVMEQAQSSSSSRLFHDSNLWERRALQPWDTVQDDATENSSIGGLPTITSTVLPSAPTMDRPSRLQQTIRRRVRLGSSNSLVTENSLEARRRADHDEVVRDQYTGTRERHPSDEMDVEMMIEEVGNNVEEDDVPRPQVSTARPPASYLLHLPPLPTPSLNVTAEPDPRYDENSFERDFGQWFGDRGMRYYAPHPHLFGGGATLRQRLAEGQDLWRALPPPEDFALPVSRPSLTTALRHLPPRPSSPPFSPLSDLELNLIASASGQGGSTRNTAQPSAHNQDDRSRIVALRRNLLYSQETPPSIPPPDLGSTFDADGHPEGLRPLPMPMRDEHLFLRRQSGADHVEYRPSSLVNPSQPWSLGETSRLQYDFPVTSAPVSHHQPLSYSAGASTSDEEAIREHRRLLDRRSQALHRERHRRVEEIIRRREEQRTSEGTRLPPLAQGIDGHGSSASGASTRPDELRPSGLWRVNRNSSESLRPVTSTVTDTPDHLSSHFRPPLRNPSLELAEDRHGFRVTAPLPPVEIRTPSSLDPATFAPGPFRNTIHQAMHHRMQHQTSTPEVGTWASAAAQPPSIPPTIPPLSFEEMDPAYYYANLSASAAFAGDEPATRPVSRPVRPQSAEYDFGRRRSSHDVEFRWSRPVTSARGSASSSTAVGGSGSGAHVSESRRSSDDLHRYLSQHVRMEPSRVEYPRSPDEVVPLPSSASTTATAGRARPFGGGRIEPIRPEGNNSIRQHQLILAHHRHQQELEQRRRVRSEMVRIEGGDPEFASNASGAASEGVSAGGATRRFGGFGAVPDADVFNYTWRNRRQARFRTVPEFLAATGRLRGMGDFMSDDDFDDSYEGLLNLASTLGDAKPKSTPADIIEKLEKGVFKDWKTDEGDKRCPICLDDYSDEDRLLKLNNCSHWLHQDCLQQWLHTANTCPVCRKSVQNEHTSSSASGARRHRDIHHYLHRLHSWRRGPPDPSGPGGTGGPSANSGSGSGGWPPSGGGFA